MAKKVHIICAKCGSDEMTFRISERTDHDCGVSLSCKCCGELTAVEEWAEANQVELKH